MRRLPALRMQQTVYATSTDTHTYKYTQRGSAQTKTAVSACFVLCFAARLIPNSTKSTNSTQLLFEFRISIAMSESNCNSQLTVRRHLCLVSSLLLLLLLRCCCQLLLLLLLLPPPRVVNSMWKLKLTTDVGHAAEGSQQSSRKQQASSSSSRQAAARHAAADANCSSCCCAALRFVCCCCGERKLLQF